MTKKMRGWPSWNTSNTAVMDTTAPNEMNRAKSCGQRLGCSQLLIRNNSGQHGGDEDVQHGANGQRGNHADRHVTLGVASLLCGCRDGIKANVGEENQGCSCRDACPSVRSERMPVHRIDVKAAYCDEAHHHHQ